MTEPIPASDEWIRQHQGFVRSLAAALLRDASERDDAVQEAWLAALRRPPENPRAWLRAVAGRLAGRLVRDRARRERREHAAARPESLPSAASTVERAEIVRLVGEVVAELREPFREALLLRYYEELPPRAIAARLDVPVATVRSRIQRGLRQAREELERRSRRTARHWTEALTLALGLDARLGAAAPSGTLLGLGATSMKTKTGWLAGAALLVASSVVVRTVSRERAPAGSGARFETAELDPPAPRAPDVEIERRPVSVPPGEPGDAGAVVTRFVRGTVVDFDGRNVPGARVLAGADARTLSERTTSDAAGAFTLAVEEGDRVVCARAAGFGPSPLASIPPPVADALALALVLPIVGVRLEVGVVDAAGAPVSGARVFAGRGEERDYRLADGTTLRTVPGFEATTDGIGVARFDGLAPGWLRVTARHRELAPATTFFTLQRDGLNFVELRLARGFHVEGTVRDEERNVVSGARISRGGLREAESDAGGRFRLGPIDAGKVIVSGPDGRTDEERLRGDPEETVRWDPVLRADATIRGRVVDADGKARAGAWTTANLDTWPGWSRGTTTGADGRFAIHGCPDGELRLEVRAGAEDPLPIVVIEGVRAGPDELLVQLAGASPVAVSGRVDLPEGARPALYLRHETTAERQRLTGGPGLELEPEVDGAFRIEGVPAGRYRIVATGEPVGWARLVAFEVGEEDLDVGALQLPRPGMLVSYFVREPGPPASTARHLLERRDELVTVLALDGELPHDLSLAPGPYVLQVEVVPGPLREYPFEIASGRTTELQVDLRSTTTHRVRIRFASGITPSGTAALTVRQLDVVRVVADGEVTRIEGRDWVHEVELGPGRFTFHARTPDGREAVATHDLFTARPDSEILLVVEDTGGS